jgi:hypothetical protein
MNSLSIHTSSECMLQPHQQSPILALLDKEEQAYMGSYAGPCNG